MFVYNTPFRLRGQWYIYIYTYLPRSGGRVKTKEFIYIFRSKTLRMASSFGMDMDIEDEDNAYSQKGDRREGHLTNYPESPSDLPRPIFERAYASGHEPPLDQLAISAPSPVYPSKLRRHSADSKQGTGSRNPKVLGPTIRKK